MEGLKVALTIFYLIVCVAIVFIVMIQDTKSQGLGAALSGSGASNSTYWSKNKGRSKEGMLNKLTIALAVIFIVLSVVLSLNKFQSKAEATTTETNTEATVTDAPATEAATE